MNVSKLLNKINSLVEWIVSVMLVIMVIVVFLQVIFRFIIQSSLSWSEEMARYLLVWISFLGASIGVKKKAHIGVEAVTMFLPDKIKKIVALIANLSAMVFFIVIIVWGYKILSIVSNQVSPAMEIPMSIPYSALSTSGVLMLLYSIENFIKTFKALKGGEAS